MARASRKREQLPDRADRPRFLAAWRSSVRSMDRGALPRPRQFLHQARTPSGTEPEIPPGLVTRPTPKGPSAGGGDVRSAPRLRAGREELETAAPAAVMRAPTAARAVRRRPVLRLQVLDEVYR